MKLEIPPVVRAKALAAGAAEWINGLPDLIRTLERDWELAVEQPLAGGTESFVAAVRVEDGSRAVLKLLIPGDRDAAHHEMTALQHADGHGCARLIRVDVRTGAMLLEHLGRPLARCGYPLDTEYEILSATVARMWRPAADSGLPTGAEKGRWLIGFITTAWEELNRPCSERAVAYAVACAERRVAAHSDDRSVLVHGDVHRWNALEADDGFKLIDPDGLLAEPEYDLGVIMREERIEPSAADRMARATHLAALTGRDAAAIWEWAAVERLSTGLMCTQVDLQPVGRQLLATADDAAVPST